MNAGIVCWLSLAHSSSGLCAPERQQARHVKRFDAARVPVAVCPCVSPCDYVQCFAPPGIGIAKLELSYNDAQLSDLRWAYRYGPPVITAMTSQPGPTAGGGVIRVDGLGFGTLLAGRVWSGGSLSPCLGTEHGCREHDMSASFTLSASVGETQAQRVTWTSGTPLARTRHRHESLHVGSATCLQHTLLHVESTLKY